MTKRKLSKRSLWLAGVTFLIQAGVTLAFPSSAEAIVINDNETPDSVLDQTNFTGIGQMVTDTKNGNLTTCTGTLINPRTVLFSAHCVNNEAATSYGSGQGGTPVSFGFAVDNKDAVTNWLSSGQRYQTNVGQGIYTVEQVNYNPASIDPSGKNYLHSDIATATLDTPASDVPTWSLLFSPLTGNSGSADKNGTGYHVSISGYGMSGIGSTGATEAIDYRRRSAENMLGALASMNDVTGFLSNTANGSAQNLYQFDFDDPKKGQQGRNPNDIDLFGDTALQKEGMTASGDSGGPLILDQSFSKEVVIGVLSGDNRYFPDQAESSYGTSAFYQPLYLYWQWIAANNPYHYATAKAGDGKWSDPDHWLSQVDPHYQILDSNGQLVNGIPSTAEAGEKGDSPKFGSLCYDNGTSRYCKTLATGNNSSGQDALPQASLENGLPNASNFVPDNQESDRLSGAKARYFDITLSADGTTTLDMNATVDRFAIDGAGAKLDIQKGYRLNSLIDVTQYNGWMNVDGALATSGDYAIITGLLTGSGSITTPYLTNVAGVIAPTGNLAVNGNLVLSSGSQLAIRLGADQTSDKLTINGLANLGGAVRFSALSGYKPHSGDKFTFLTASDGLSGQFANASGIDGILNPILSYDQNSVTAIIKMNNYQDIVDSHSSVQKAYAQLLDQNRQANGTGLDNLYTRLDLMDAAHLQSTLESMAPRNEATIRALDRAGSENMTRFFRQRLNRINHEDMGGSLAFYGQPLAFASASSSRSLGQRQASDISDMVSLSPHIKFVDTVSAFVASGYLNGHNQSMPSSSLSGHDNFNGWFLAGGAEIAATPKVTAGIGFSYSNLNGDSSSGQTSKASLTQATLYASYKLPAKLILSGQVSGGVFSSTNKRRGSIDSLNYNFRQKGSSFSGSAEVVLGRDIDLSHLIITPNIAVRGQKTDGNNLTDRALDGSDSSAALELYRKAYNSVQTRAGFDISGEVKTRGVTLVPHTSAHYVHELLHPSQSVAARFVNGVGGNAAFILPNSDHNWGEVEGGLKIKGRRIDFDISAGTVFGRQDLAYNAYRGSITYHF
ncbi:autotransporter domain-containing protein [Zymomonas mobilis]|uniref:Outer membrane autotransporter barrel domain protein n=1 Tax=Zymomonas mobilis subsp. mobilis (strain ATCC 10988 / DSM 424 / LMG 404 / NCIMB 8938 / NRRL B-806 / ZM1) TaxID=555217 RepID=A0A0H3G494_ZYMMA|nr:autotransporter domain-containing protein [Zymomonas mobilis]AEH63450.1 outer membrane autotransporter barrel domain protein [Zymomonas mobilis subsp. mobilis ATCC 10988]TQL26935.1 trypsin [Zymomonas mobilis]TQL30582.1 trypsin [Zymomonas mobilis]